MVGCVLLGREPVGGGVYNGIAIGDGGTSFGFVFFFFRRWGIGAHPLVLEYADYYSSSRSTL